MKLVGVVSETLSSLQGIECREKPQEQIEEVFNREIQSLQAQEIYDISRSLLLETVPSPPSDLAWERVGIGFDEDDATGVGCKVSVDFSSFPDHEVHKEPELTVYISNGHTIARANIKRRQTEECKLQKLIIKEEVIKTESALEQIVNLLRSLTNTKGVPKYPKGADSWEHAQQLRSV